MIQVSEVRAGVKEDTTAVEQYRHLTGKSLANAYTHV